MAHIRFSNTRSFILLIAGVPWLYNESILMSRNVIFISRQTPDASNMRYPNADDECGDSTATVQTDVISIYDIR